MLADDEFARLRSAAGARPPAWSSTTRGASRWRYCVAERLRGDRVPGRRDYLDAARAAGSPERQALLDEVTIQETHFFRNPPQMRALRQHVLPELLRHADARGRRLRIWSAGCSTGEEPYTIAMLLRELLPSDGRLGRARSSPPTSRQRALEAARAGDVRRARGAAGHRPSSVARFFAADRDGRYEVRPEVRDLVEFRHHNLVHRPVPFAATSARPGAVPQRHDLLQPRDDPRR